MSAARPTARTSARPASGLALALAACTLLSTACGARLSEGQRQDALTGSGGRLAQPVGGDGLTPVDAADIGPVVDDPVAGPAAGPADGPVDAAGSGTESSDGAAAGPADGPVDAAGPAAPKAGPAGPAASGDTRAAPAGGNGGATDKGVTATEVVLANIADISGAVPGLFEDAQLAVKAYVQFFAASEGTVYGRKLKLLPLDSRLDTGANRSASIQACGESFAAAGSVSAFDQGGADVIAKCGLPDLRGLATTDQMKAVPNAYPVQVAGTGGQRSLGSYGWVKAKFPEAVKKAAYLYQDGEVTRQTAQQDIEATEKGLGYSFVYQSGIAVQETNYAPFVQQMKSKGVRYVTFVGAYQQAASLAKTMQQQGFKPDVYAPTVTAYTPEYLKLGGAAVEGSFVAVGPSLVEEIAGNPELQKYARWLNQVEPGASPTAIGQYAWGAAALFVDKLKKIGPKPTRKALLAEVATVTGYTGNGLFPKQDVGGKTLTDCVSVVRVQGGKFVRFEPAGTGKKRCGDGVFDTKSDRVVKRG